MPVWLELGVPVWVELGVLVWLEVGVPVVLGLDVPSSAKGTVTAVAFSVSLVITTTLA